jgi:hypothetical protein
MSNGLVCGADELFTDGMAFKKVNILKIIQNC